VSFTILPKQCVEYSERKIVLVHAMMARKERGCIDPFMFNLRTRWRWVVRL